MVKFTKQLKTKLYKRGDKMKKYYFIYVLLSLVIFYSCGNETKSDSQKIKIAAISGYFGQGFGKSMVEGLEKARDDFDVELKIVDVGTRSLDYEDQLSSLAQTGEYSLIFLMGWELANALEVVSKSFPTQKFVFVDGVLDNPNVYYVNFAEEQGSFLVGAMAAMMTTRTDIKYINTNKIVGFVGGRDIPVIRNFLNGYQQGVRYIDSSIEVREVFTGSFDDPARGNELAQSLYSANIDIIYSVAGPSGEGVLQAAGISKKYAVGVDVDQCASAPGYIAGSMLKRADIGVYDMVEQYVKNPDIKPGVFTYDIIKGGVQLCNDDYMKEIVPKNILDNLELIKQRVIDGEIKIESIM